MFNLKKKSPLHNKHATYNRSQLLSVTPLPQGVTTVCGAACLICQSFMVDVAPDTFQRGFVSGWNGTRKFSLAKCVC